MTAQPDLLTSAMTLAVHELATPLSIVGGYVRLLLRDHGGPLTDKQRHMLEEAEKSCNRLGSLLIEMREFRKLEAGEIELAQQEVDIAGLLAELASAMHEGQDRGVRLELRGTNQPLVVTGDRARLAAAFKVLMYSVLRERYEPGAIVTECSMFRDASGSAYALVAFGDQTVLSSLTVHANDGQAPPFDEWREGLGMGLPIARRVIEDHGGAVWSANGARTRAASALRLPLRS